jgi:hypothetical protein
VLAHDSPEKAIGIFLGIVNYERNRELLLQMPPSVAEDFVPNRVAPATRSPRRSRPAPIPAAARGAPTAAGLRHRGRKTNAGGQH